jgi:hypothetical protein
MSVERIQLLHEDYIRLTERFKALWTFHQFLRGVQKMFFSNEADGALDFGKLYDDVRSVAGAIETSSLGFADSRGGRRETVRRMPREPADPERVAPRIRDLSERLEAFARRLREADRRISASHVRRFFERVRPEDGKIALHLLRFYFWQPDVDEDVVDKVDLLATVLVAASAPGESPGPRPHGDLRRLFEAATAGSAWPPPDPGSVATIVRSFDELAADMARTQEFEDLVKARLLNNLRLLKRSVAGGLANPDVLAAVVSCNLRTRLVFERLFEREEHRLEEATRRIEGLQKELARGGVDAPPSREFDRFRESRLRFEHQSRESNLKATQVIELKEAIADVLGRFELADLAAEDIDEVLDQVEENGSNGSAAEFWRPRLDLILGAVELYDDGSGHLRAELPGLEHLELDPWELEAARRAVSEGGEIRSERDRLRLRAVALRMKAEEETATLRSEGECPSAESLRSARATLARVPALEAALSLAVDEAEARGSSDEVRAWARTRHRLMRATSELWLVQDAAGGRLPGRFD